MRAFNKRHKPKHYVNIGYGSYRSSKRYVDYGLNESAYNWIIYSRPKGYEV